MCIRKVREKYRPDRPTFYKGDSSTSIQKPAMNFTSFMFVFKVARTPTPSFTCAQQAMFKTRKYVMSSKDSTQIYLTSAIAAVRRTATLWSQAKGNSTSSHRQIMSGKCRCKQWELVLTWLARRSGIEISDDLNSDEMDDFKHYLSEVVLSGGRIGKMVNESLKRDSI
jgi:hypothetical protein